MPGKSEATFAQSPEEVTYYEFLAQPLLDTLGSGPLPH